MDNASPLAREASIPNPCLDAFAPFIGSWTTVAHHSMMPGVTLNGRTVFEWYEGGAYLRVLSDVEEAGIPSAVSLIGSADDDDTFTMLYFDERCVSRRFHVSVADHVLRWRRTAPGFSQRYALTLAADRMTAHGVSEMSKDDKTWERDMDVGYTRAS